MTIETANSFKGRLFYLGVSILINCFFNALTVATNMGSAIWTASGVNLAQALNIPLGTTLFLEGVVVAFANLLLLGEFDYFRLGRNLMFIIPFSYCLAGFEHLFIWIGVPNFPLWARLLLDLIGLVGVAQAVSIYQRANLIIHPNDDLPYILRFRFMKGSPVWSQWASNVPPILIILICWIITKKLSVINIGTVINIAFQGALIGWGDTHIFPKLHHHLEFKTTKINP